MPPMTAGVGVRALSLVLVAACVTALTLFGLKDEAVGFDLVTVYVPAAERVLDGDSLFPTLDDPVFSGHQAYVYPPLTALLTIPLTALPAPVLEIAGVLGALALMLLALWIVGVRDPRCYAVFTLWPPTMTAWQNANVTVLLLLAIALTWRLRDSAAKTGVALGLGIALKLLLWPLTLWLLLTRRIRAAVASAVVAAVALVVSWGVIGFEGVTAYPDLLSRLTEIEGENGHGVSIYSGMIAFGIPSGVAHATSLFAGAGLAAGSFLYARRGDDRASFTLALVAVLAFTPLVWLHYLTFLVVPLAIYRPRLSGAWAIPWLFWAVTLPGWPFEPRRAIAFVVVIALVARLLTAPDGAPSTMRRSSVPRSAPLPEGGR